MLKSIFVVAALISVPAFAKTCKIEVGGTDQMKYDKSELTLEKGCTEVELTLKHVGKLQKSIMGHNWILAKDLDVTGIAAEGMKAGPTKDYLPASDKRILAHTTMVGGGETTTVTFKKDILKVGENYAFFCSFPGHSSMMKGKFIVK